jgi:hypothetical protein
MIMSVEDKHLDVLQNIEFAIMQVYQEKPDLIDIEVMTAIETLSRLYDAEAQGRSGTSRSLKGTTAQVAEQVKSVCEMRLRRVSIDDQAEQISEEEMAPKTLIDIVDCLKRIQSSIKFWTKKSGRQGYLNFVSQFFQDR